MRSITVGAGRLVLVPPDGRGAVLSLESTIDGVPILGPTDMLGVDEALMALAPFGVEISAMSSIMSKLAVVLFLGVARCGPGIFHSPFGSMVTCSKSRGVLDRMSRTYL